MVVIEFGFLSQNLMQSEYWFKTTSEIYANPSDTMAETCTCLLSMAPQPATCLALLW